MLEVNETIETKKMYYMWYRLESLFKMVLTSLYGRFSGEDEVKRFIGAVAIVIIVNLFACIIIRDTLVLLLKTTFRTFFLSEAIYYSFRQKVSMPSWCRISMWKNSIRRKITVAMNWFIRRASWDCSHIKLIWANFEFSNSKG